MNLTEEQLDEAKRELARRDKEQAERYHQEYIERQRAADERFRLKMEAAYPGIDADTRYSIYADYRDHYE